MNWKTLCREIFLSNKHNPQLHRLVCNSCLFAVQDSQNCSTGKKSVNLHQKLTKMFYHAAISLKPSKARLNLVQESCLIMDGDESSESSSDSTDEELFQIRQSISDTSLHSEGETLSKINLLAPSSSTTTLIHRYLGQVEEIVQEFESGEVNDTQYLTRDELRKRLQELVNKSIKNFNNDDEVKMKMWFQVSYNEY